MLASIQRTLLVSVLASSLTAQAPGLRIFQGIGTEPSQMVDELGNLVHDWPGLGALSAHIAPDGTLVRAVQTITSVGGGGATGRIQRLAFDGTLLWDYLVDGPTQFAHHDVEPMPNGNVLVLAWELYTTGQAIAQGRDPALLQGTDWLPDAILELQPTGLTSAIVVWEWHMMDHIAQEFDPGKPNFVAIAQHPELLDINYPPIVLGNGDWNHCNGLDYDPINDWIIVSARSQNEIYIIDHSTTTAEAAGHSGGLRGKGGDLLYRWGNPQAYQAGDPIERQLFGQHDARFVPAGSPGAGHVTLFNNRYLPNQSAVFELELPLDASGNFLRTPGTGQYGPLAPLWVFTEPGLFSAFVSSAERLPNGNTLICSGLQSRLLEVTPAGQTVWSYVEPNAAFLFQCHYVDRSLWADATGLPVSGGAVVFDHLLGSPHAGQVHMLLGSISGTAPGTMIPGGVLLPLNTDYLTNAMAISWNSGVFVDTLGTLGGNGDGSSAIVVGAGFIPAVLIGTDMDFAHLIFDNALAAVRAGNTVGVTIVP